MQMGVGLSFNPKKKRELFEMQMVWLQTKKGKGKYLRCQWGQFGSHWSVLCLDAFHFKSLKKVKPDFNTSTFGVKNDFKKKKTLYLNAEPAELHF